MFLATRVKTSHYFRTSGQHSTEEIRKFDNFLANQNTGFAVQDIASFSTVNSSSFASFTATDLSSFTSQSSVKSEQSFTSQDLPSFDTGAGYSFSTGDQSSYVSGNLTSDQSSFATDSGTGFTSYNSTNQSSLTTSDQSGFTTSDQSNYTASDQSRFTTSNQYSFKTEDQSGFTGSDQSSHTSFNQSYTIGQQNGIGWQMKGIKSCVGPNGKLFRSKRSAIEYLLKTGGSQAEIEELRKLYTEEGWTTEGLPEGWLGKADTKSYSFITADAKFFSGKTNVISYMIEIGSSEDDKNLLQAFSFDRDIYKRTPRLPASLPANLPRHVNTIREVRQISTDAPNWLDGGLDLPAGWKTKGEGGCRRIMAPDGKVFPGLRWFLLHMIKENYPSESVEELRAKMPLHGWQKDILLPNNWFFKKVEFKQNGHDRRAFEYCSEDGSLFQGHKGAFLHLTSEENSYSEQQKQCFKMWADKNGGMRRINNDEPYRQREKESRAQTASTGLDVKVDPELVQAAAEAKLQADQLRAEKAKEDQKERIKKLERPKISEIFRTFDDETERQEMLQTNGWYFNRFLPVGWMARRAGKNRVAVLTSSGKVLESYAKVVDFMKADPQFAQDDIDKFLLYPDGVSSLTRRNKILGDDTESASAATIHQENNSTETATNTIETEPKTSVFKTEAKNSDWKTSLNLPSGWTYKDTPSTSSYLCLRSEDGTKLTSLKAAAGYMEWRGGFSHEDITNLYLFPGGDRQGSKRKGGEEEEEVTLIDIVESPVKKLKVNNEDEVMKHDEKKSEQEDENEVEIEFEIESLPKPETEEEVKELGQIDDQDEDDDKKDNIEAEKTEGKQSVVDLESEEENYASDLDVEQTEANDDEVESGTMSDEPGTTDTIEDMDEDNDYVETEKKKVDNEPETQENTEDLDDDKESNVDLESEKENDASDLDEEHTDPNDDEVESGTMSDKPETNDTNEEVTEDNDYVDNEKKDNEPDTKENTEDLHDGGEIEKKDNKSETKENTEDMDDGSENEDHMDDDGTENDTQEDSEEDDDISIDSTPENTEETAAEDTKDVTESSEEISDEEDNDAEIPEEQSEITKHNPSEEYSKAHIKEKEMPSSVKESNKDVQNVESESNILTGPPEPLVSKTQVLDFSDFGSLYAKLKGIK